MAMNLVAGVDASGSVIVAGRGTDDSTAVRCLASLVMSRELASAAGYRHPRYAVANECLVDACEFVSEVGARRDAPERRAGAPARSFPDGASGLGALESGL
jgi:hypothetical protein